MTTALKGNELARQIEGRFPGSVVASTGDAILINSKELRDIACYLRDTPGLEFNYLNHVTAVDYYDYFEVVYGLTSLVHNHSLTLKTRCSDRINPLVPSVVGLWRGADYQEREIYDLMGITFEGHPNMKRIVLWPGFAGHPLRKDYL